MYSLIQRRSHQTQDTTHKLVHAWGQDRLDTKIQRQLTSLALELLVDATADNQLHPSYKLRLVPHSMASFGIHVKTHDSIHKITRDRLAMIANKSQ